MDEDQIVLDLTRRHFVKERGDMLIYGTWIYNDGQEADEPCLAIMPKYRHGYPCVVALSAAYKYADSPAYLAAKSKEFLAHLGFEDSMRNAIRLGELIYDHLTDLLQMPNNPTMALQVGEATVTNGSAKTSAKIYDYENIKD